MIRSKLLPVAVLSLGCSACGLATPRLGPVRASRHPIRHQRRPASRCDSTCTCPSPARRAAARLGPWRRLGERQQIRDAARAARRARLRRREPRLQPGLEGAASRARSTRSRRRSASCARRRSATATTPSRIGIAGASSGAHLAAVVGTSNGHARARRRARRPPRRILRGARHRVVFRRDESDDDPRAVDAVRARHSRAGAEAPARRARRRTPSRSRGSRAPCSKSTAATRRCCCCTAIRTRRCRSTSRTSSKARTSSMGSTVDFIVVHGAAHGGDAFYSPENVERVAAFLERAAASLASAQR